MKIHTIVVGTILLISLNGCSKKKLLPPSVTESFNELNLLIQQPKLDTSALKTALNSAFVLSDKASNVSHDTLLSTASYMLGNTLTESGRYSDARFYFQKGLVVGLRHLSKDVYQIARLYRQLGRTYYKQEDYKSALTYFDSVNIAKPDTNAWILIVNNRSNMAECYQRLKNKEAADVFYRENTQNAEKYLTNKEKAIFYNKYSFFLKDNKQYQQAINIAKKNVSICETIVNQKNAVARDSEQLANAYYFIAYAAQDSTAFRLAEPFYHKALAIYKKLNSMDSYRRGLLNMGLMYRYDKQFDKAFIVLTEGISQLDTAEQTDFNVVRKAQLFNNRAEVFMDLGNYPKAISDHDSAINYFTIYDRRGSLTTLLLSKRTSLLTAYSDNAKAYAALDEKGINTEGYQKALNLTDSIIQLSDDIRADYFSDDAKMNLANDIKPALERAIGFCQKLYEKTKNVDYLQKALSFVEFSRSMVLFENARLSNQLPAELKAENGALKKQEAALVTKNNVDDLQIYLGQKRQFREKIKSLNRHQVPSLATFQNDLLPIDRRTAFIEYFVGDSTVSVFVMTKDSLNIFTQTKTADFDKQIARFRQEFTQATPVSDATQFAKLSSDLYNKLLRGAISTLPPSVDKLIIAPDGVLSYLPFEILTPEIIGMNHPSVSTANFRQNHYLIERFQISYAYSASLLLEQKRMKKQSAPSVFGGFAPKYLDKDTLQKSKLIASRAVLTREGAYELKGAKEEVEVISQLLNGKPFTDDAANESAFKQTAHQYQILHCAMHSLTDDADPMHSKLLFTLQPQDTTQDGDLTAAELYTLSLKADLAVLSACNTGFGKISNGEGVMSIARAFTYAGVPATVTSLWKVPDLTTREIMVDFYKNLKKGMTKDAALRQAKLTYLENAPESVAANPYFWAGFVPMGNMEAMDLSGNDPLSMVWILAGLLALIVVVWFYRKKMNFTSQ